jgi:dsRNA-specific ribonuclease
MAVMNPCGGYCFKNIEAMQLIPNVRLDYIGNTLLNTVISVGLFEHNMNAFERDLYRWHAHLVSREICSVIAKSLRVTGNIKGVIGAIFLDSDKNYDLIHAWIMNLWSSHFENSCSCAVPIDAKTMLQERTQKSGLGLPMYVDVTMEHSIVGYEGFQVKVFVASSPHPCMGMGTTKKQAEKDAAAKMIRVLNESRDFLMSTAQHVRGGIVFPGCK